MSQKINFCTKITNSKEDSNTEPIKVVFSGNNESLLQGLSSTIKGWGTSTAIKGVLIPTLDHGGKERVLRVLLDSGSDGDMFFLRKSQMSSVRAKRRISRIKWQTSCGAFTTEYVAEIGAKLPDFSPSKWIDFPPDIVLLSEKDSPPPLA